VAGECADGTRLRRRAVGRSERAFPDRHHAGRRDGESAQCRARCAALAAAAIGCPHIWDASIQYVEQHYAASGGFDFNDDRDGIWWEGTAQAALAYRALGRSHEADRLLSEINGQFSPGGFVWASSQVRLTTGLGLSPASTTDDFYYYRLPHLGATAWAALAAVGWNPFTGESVTNGR
jgi:hypothetical protein